MTLPAGMTVSPSAAHGLQACSDAQFGLGTEFGPGQEEQKKHSEELTKHFVPETPAKAASCPEASQVGTVEVFTPLLSGAPTAEGVLESGLGLECSRGYVERRSGTLLSVVSQWRPHRERDRREVRGYLRRRSPRRSSAR